LSLLRKVEEASNSGERVALQERNTPLPSKDILLSPSCFGLAMQVIEVIAPELLRGPLKRVPSTGRTIKGLLVLLPVLRLLLASCAKQITPTSMGWLHTDSKTCPCETTAKHRRFNEDGVQLRWNSSKSFFFICICLFLKLVNFFILNVIKILLNKMNFS
jgi:hypothetical protein